jgi:predicted RNA-binding protein YlqC (UPF0109 family)
VSDRSPVFESPVFGGGEDDDLGEDLEEESAGPVTGGRPQAVLEHIARSLVDEPDAVEVRVSQGRSGVTLSLHVAPEDMGRVIGKRGRIAQALRTLVRAAGAREGMEASVDIVD